MTLEEVFRHLGQDDPLRSQAFRELFHIAQQCVFAMGFEKELAEEALQDVMMSWLRRDSAIEAEDPHAYLQTALRNRCKKLWSRRKRCPSYVGLCGAKRDPSPAEQAPQTIDAVPSEGMLGSWYVELQDSFSVFGPILEESDDFSERMEGVRGWLVDRVPPLISRADRRRNTSQAIDMLFDIYLDVHSQRSLALLESPDASPETPAFDRALSRVQKKLSRARVCILELLEDTHTRSTLGLGKGDHTFLTSLFTHELRERAVA
jgi:DNA-directed RNA polymerase specialized sigma24 family protein